MRVAQMASYVMTNKNTGTKSNTTGGSALLQTKAPKKVTSKSASGRAYSVLRDFRTGKRSKFTIDAHFRKCSQRRKLDEKLETTKMTYFMKSNVATHIIKISTNTEV